MITESTSKDSPPKQAIENLDLTSEEAEADETPAEVAVAEKKALPEAAAGLTPQKLLGDKTITPQKRLTPKQIQKKMDSEKKKQLRQQEKEEREKKKQEERDQKEKKRLEEKEEKEKKRQEEEKLKLKEKEEKQKQKEEKEEQKRLEREAKLKEKEDKKKEKEEKEEMRRKEKEEKEKKEERKKQMDLEQKEKAAMVFSKFFVTKKTDSVATEEKKEEIVAAFMPFSVKPDMKLAPTCRRQLIDAEKDALTKFLDAQTDDTYLKDLKGGKVVKRKSDRTWPVEDNNDDVMIMEENNESIIAQERKVERMRAKMLKFHENRRPAYFGTWRKKSKAISARKPFVTDTTHFDYEVDSDDDWEEEVQGESLAGSDDEEKENASENDYEEDNEFFVPHGYLSEGEGDEDEDKAPMSPETHKAKLKLLKSKFEEEIHSKTERLKPRLIGCVREDRNPLKAQNAFHTFLQAYAAITNGTIQIKKRNKDSVLFQTASSKKSLSERKLHPKQLSKDLVPTFLQLIHGNTKNQMFIVNEFLNYMTAKNLPVELSKGNLGHQLKVLATWMKCPEEGPMYNKYCWYVSEDVRQRYKADVSLPNKWNYTTSA